MYVLDLNKCTLKCKCCTDQRGNLKVLSLVCLILGMLSLAGSLKFTPAPIGQAGRAHTMALPYTGMTSQNIFIGGVFQIFHTVKMLEKVGIFTR